MAEMSNNALCAIYARSAAVDQRSIDEQLAACRAAAAAHGLTAGDCDVFVDEGCSGHSAPESRPGWSRLLESVQAGGIGTIIARDPSRLSRGPYPHSADDVCRSLTTAGVTVLFANGGRSIDISKYLEERLTGIAAEKELARMVERTTRGRVRRERELVHRGFYRAKPPFGFQHRPDDTTPAGYERAARRGEWRLVPDEITLPLVVRIFAEFDSGASVNEIAGALRAAEAPAPRQRWTSEGVRVILRNPIYAGRLVWGSVRHPEANHVVDGFLPDPPINPELFDRVQTRLNSATAARVNQGSERGRLNVGSLPTEI